MRSRITRNVSVARRASGGGAAPLGPRRQARPVTASTMGRPTAAAATSGGLTGGAAADGEAGTALPRGVSACAPAGGGSRRTPATSARPARAVDRRKGRWTRGGADAADVVVRAIAPGDTSVAGDTVCTAAYGGASAVGGAV